MIPNSNIMAERRETGIGKLSAREALGSLLAAAGLALASCGDNGARAQSPNEANTPPANEYLLADAEEARTFASLSAEAQREIRAAYDECMAEVEEFARDGNEDDPEGYQIELEDGQADCDGQRKSRIGIAKSKQNIEETTRSITSAG